MQNPKRATEKNQNGSWRKLTELVPRYRPVTPVARGSQGVAQNALGGWQKRPPKKTKKNPKKPNRTTTEREAHRILVFRLRFPVAKKHGAPWKINGKKWRTSPHKKRQKPKNSDRKTPK
jgi:hypothetical protein